MTKTILEIIRITQEAETREKEKIRKNKKESNRLLRYNMYKNNNELLEIHSPVIGWFRVKKKEAHTADILYWGRISTSRPSHAIIIGFT